jgi:hypothetical protein
MSLNWRHQTIFAFTSARSRKLCSGARRAVPEDSSSHAGRYPQEDKLRYCANTIRDVKEQAGLDLRFLIRMNSLCGLAASFEDCPGSPFSREWPAPLTRTPELHPINLDSRLRGNDKPEADTV